MKVSKYNFFYPVEDGKYLVYNALRNGLALVDASPVEILRSEGSDYSKDLAPEMLEGFLQGGFLVDDGEDEFQLLQLRWRMGQFATHALSLTIAPTTDCNLGCRYCFENHTPITMDEATEAAISDFVSTYLKAGVTSLVVTWYGGEPLLCQQTVERLGRKLADLCEAEGATYYSSMVTNGTLLDRKTAEALIEARVSEVQITLDGFRPAHNQRRPYKDGTGSFDKIYGHLANLPEGLGVTVRINVDRENAMEGLAFAESFRNEPWFDPERFHLYFGYIRKYGASCLCSDEEILKPGEFHRHEFDIMQQAVEAGQGTPRYPRPMSGCVATSRQGFVVGPEGEVYKCWNHVGDPKQSIGNVRTPMPVTGLHAAYLMDGFEQDHDCTQCRYLPICMGGCVDVRVKARLGEMAGKDCTGWKYYLERALRLFFESKIKAQAGAVAK